MSDDILDNVTLLIVSGIIGFVLVVLGAAFDSIFLKLFGGIFLGIPSLRIIIEIINQVR